MFMTFWLMDFESFCCSLVSAARRSLAFFRLTLAKSYLPPSLPKNCCSASIHSCSFSRRTTFCSAALQSLPMADSWWVAFCTSMSRSSIVFCAWERLATRACMSALALRSSSFFSSSWSLSSEQAVVQLATSFSWSASIASMEESDSVISLTWSALPAISVFISLISSRSTSRVCSTFCRAFCAFMAAFLASAMARSRLFICESRWDSASCDLSSSSAALACASFSFLAQALICSFDSAISASNSLMAVFSCCTGVLLSRCSRSSASCSLSCSTDCISRKRLAFAICLPMSFRPSSIWSRLSRMLRISSSCLSTGRPAGAVPPVRLPRGSTTWPSRLTARRMTPLSKATVLAFSRVEQTSDVPKTNSTAFWTSFSQPTSDSASEAFSLPTSCCARSTTLAGTTLVVILSSGMMCTLWRRLPLLMSFSPVSTESVTTW
mmetsp:Transcript_18250/g.70527  ORF Transcript_18250/g.70527 Transcript_18250/m.70527 type:complete len:437 (+) Transcript_18250:607-1917(+)